MGDAVGAPSKSARSVGFRGLGCDVWESSPDVT